MRNHSLKNMPKSSSNGEDFGKNRTKQCFNCLDAQVRRRINWSSVNRDGEVAVVAEGIARIAHIPDQLALADLLAHRDRHGIHMIIFRHHAVSMVDEHTVAVTACLPTSLYNRPAVSSHNLGIGGSRQIQSVVQAAPPVSKAARESASSHRPHKGARRNAVTLDNLNRSSGTAVDCHLFFLSADLGYLIDRRFQKLGTGNRTAGLYAVDINDLIGDLFFAVFTRRYHFFIALILAAVFRGFLFISNGADFFLATYQLDTQPALLCGYTYLVASVHQVV